MSGCCVGAEWRVSDELWERVEPLLPSYPKSPKGGRPRADLRGVLDAVFYFIRTGCQWKAIPRCLAAPSTAHDYFQHWVGLGLFWDLWAEALAEYDDLVGIDWEWQCVDGAMTKAPLGGGGTGPNPTDRGKLGTKRSVAAEGNGVPVGAEVAGANVHDKWLLEDTLMAGPMLRPAPSADAPQHLCLDKGYDYPDIRELVGQYGFCAHIRARGEEAGLKARVPGYRARRWVVERTHSWINRFRRLLIRWEKKVENYQSILYFACAIITWRAAGVFG